VALMEAVGRRLNHQYIIRCWPPRIPSANSHSATKWGVKREMAQSGGKIDLARGKSRVNSVAPWSD